MASLVALLLLISLMVSSLSTNDEQHLEEIYEFEMDWIHKSVGSITRKIRAYFCIETTKVHLSLIDNQPINGFDAFPIGLAKFNTADLSQTEMKSIDGVIIGSSAAFIEGKYILILQNDNEHVDHQLLIEYKESKNDQLIQHQFTLRPVKDGNGNDIGIDPEERASKCWIPYDTTENIEALVSNGQSIWRTNLLPHLNGFDLDIFNDDGKGNGCWAWTDEHGNAVAVKSVGTAGGMNTDYQYWFNGDLMSLRWTDHGTWISEKTKYCHHGSSLFMIIGKEEAAVTFTCDDGITGSQMFMYHQKDSGNLRCPLLKYDKIEL